MSVSLKKGQKISLSKENIGLSKLMIGLGWDEAAKKKISLFALKPREIDCDSAAILLQNGKFVNNADVVYFGNLKHHTGAVCHRGDNLTGVGAGDDEQIMVDLSTIPSFYDRIVIVVNIYQAAERRQHFGMIQNAFCRLVNMTNNQEMCRYNLTEDYSGMTAMILGEVYRRNGEWKFSAVGQGTNDKDLGALARRFG